MISQQQWNDTKMLCKATLQSSMHFSIASVDANGMPHVTPIGSLMLGDLVNGHGQACYFEKFTRALPSHAQNNQNVCILAVNSSKWFWLKSLIRGQFYQQPAVRLNAHFGPLRKATEQELFRWQKRVKVARFTQGHQLMWQAMSHVRELTVTSITPVKIGKMTPSQ